MKKPVGILCVAVLLTLGAFQRQEKTEPAGAMLLGSVLLAAATTIRHKARKV